MPETPEELFARVSATADEEGRLPMPPVAEWDVFPFDGTLTTRPLLAPVDTEPPRVGEDGVDCPACADPTHDVIWENDRWVVRTTRKPTGLPLVLFLMTKEHMDFPHMDDDLASEFGRISLWLTRIIEGMAGIGRVHIGRWGDGSEHHHVWFMARPERIPQLRGNFAAVWDDIVPPPPEEVWRADHIHVAQRLALHDGRSLL